MAAMVVMVVGVVIEVVPAGITALPVITGVGVASGSRAAILTAVARGFAVSRPFCSNYKKNIDSSPPSPRRLCRNCKNCHNLSGHSFRTYVRNLKMLNLLRSRFLAALRNDTKTNCDTVSKRGKVKCQVVSSKSHSIIFSFEAPIPSHLIDNPFSR